uniref:Uncharacterized protein n=1 Tax=Rhizophora mucronata TaxID=61149 RepID=A0A2P2IIM9_RHIMU
MESEKSARESDLRGSGSEKRLKQSEISALWRDGRSR